MGFNSNRTPPPNHFSRNLWQNKSRLNGAATLGSDSTLKPPITNYFGRWHLKMTDANLVQGDWKGKERDPSSQLNGIPQSGNSPGVACRRICSQRRAHASVTHARSASSKTCSAPSDSIEKKRTHFNFNIPFIRAISIRYTAHPVPTMRFGKAGHAYINTRRY